MGETCYDDCLIITPEEGLETVSVETLVVPDYSLEDVYCLPRIMNGWRLVIAMSGPGHVGGAHIKGAAMSGPGWLVVTRCLCCVVPSGADI